MSPAPPHFSLVLVARGSGPSAAWIENALDAYGYALLRATTAHEVLEQARGSRADLIVLAGNLPDSDAASLCRTLRADPDVGPAIPLVLISPEPASSTGRVAALRAGAWEVFHHPVDLEELLLKIRVFSQAKCTGDRNRDESLIDPATGLYSPNGLLRRAREIGAEADRYHRPIACIALKPSLAHPFIGLGTGDRHDTMARAVQRMVAVFRQHARTSDVVGRLSRDEFAIIAPGTDSAGALPLVQRLCRAAAEPESIASGIPIKLKVGCFAVADFHLATLTPADMLMHAARELNRPTSTGRGSSFAK
ncbi:hypothetical protein BH20GEM2_BH20GEM2_05820 [soil metagenome]